MNKIFTSKIDITVLITSIFQREITIETANYYSKICSEVILVDEEQPFLPVNEISTLKKKGITYIPHEISSYKGSYDLICKKRLIAAKQSSKKYVVHSNHDERYTYHGLLACLTELEKDRKLAFCAGQAIAVRKDALQIYYTQSYKNLFRYQNLDNNVEQRMYHRAKIYVPIAHYAVWRKELYINTAEKTILTHKLLPTGSTILDEVIFEFAADLVGNSKAISDLYWVRNRINKPYEHQNKHENIEDSLKIIKKKLDLLLRDLLDIKVDFIINSLYKNFPNIQKKSLIHRCILYLRLIIRSVMNLKVNERRKGGFNDIEDLLAKSNIKYEKEDLRNLINSMKL